MLKVGDKAPAAHLPSSAWMATAADGRRVVIREPEHAPRGEPCSLCGLPAARHRKRRGEPSAGRRAQQSAERSRERRELARAERNAEPIVAIDGEGKGRRPHLLTYLAASDEEGVKRGEVFSATGLSSLQCLDFLVDLGVSRVFGFSLGYDFAMILRDLPDELLYDLARPERRAKRLESGRIVHRPRYWRGFKLNYMRRRLTVQRVRWDHDRGRYVPRSHTLTIWDVFAFYQTRFVRALEAWQSAPVEVLARIEAMKERRSTFERVAAAEVHAYCDEECVYLARLVRKLIEASEHARLPLTNAFYGAGTLGGLLLKRMGVKDFIGEVPDEARAAVSCGFFGGRFELSRCGPVTVPCWGHDISSAYPYQMAQLPCLVHGRWTHVVGGRELERRIREARLALVHCEVRRSGPTSWGPLPWRRKDGAILFPRACGGTWAWRDEYLAATETLWPGVRADHAWVYDTRCDCLPFREVPEAYIERCRLGKDGPGIVLKLGINSGYGKTAQSVGSAPFRSWVWAGVITSGCRAQILRAVAAARDPASVLMIATDGILATERLELPAPIDLGTSETGKPLGGWEIKPSPGGSFLARPGIYWPLGASPEELKSVIKSRGISAKVLLEHSDRIARHFEDKGVGEPYQIRATKNPETGELEGGVVRFMGLRQGIRRGRDGIVRDRNFADWVDYPMTVSFDPDPKRARVRPDHTLECWERMPGESSAYRKDTSADGKALRQLEAMRREQPDGDLVLV